MVLGAKIGTATGINGFYIIKNLPLGRYILRSDYLAYRSHYDTVIIQYQDDIVDLNIKLRSFMVNLDSVSSPENEAYHKKLEEMNNIKPVMLVYIDSLTFSDNNFSAYLSGKILGEQVGLLHRRNH